MRQVRMFAALLAFTLSTFGPAAAAGPQLSVTAPQPGQEIKGNRVTVTFTVSDFKLVPTTVPVAEAGKHPESNKPGEGHLHFVLDLQPLVVWESGEAYTFDNVPPGEHQLMVEMVNNDHSPLAPPVMQQIRFRSGTPGNLPVTGAAHPDRAIALLVLALLLAAAGWLLPRRGRAA